MEEAGDAIMSEQSRIASIKNTNRWDTRQLVTMGLMTALAALLSFVQFPIFPGADFLKYDPSLAASMVVGFAYGAGPGMVVALLAATIQGLIMGNWVGALMNYVAALCFILPASLIYKRFHTFKGAIGGLLVSIVVVVVGNCVSNLTLGVWFFYGSADAILPLMLPAVIPFNIMKAGLNSLLALAVYKTVSNLITPKKDQVKGRE